MQQDQVRAKTDFDNTCVVSRYYSEPAVSEPIKLVDAPVSIVTGSSRGNGKAIALALGGAGGKVRSERGVALFCNVLF